MNNFLEKTDSYAEKGGRAAKQFQFSCIRAGNAAVLRKDMSTKIFRNNLEQLFCGDLTSANYSLNFVWAQAWNIAVESGVLEKAADQLYNEICFRAKHAVTVKQLVDLHIELLVRYAEAVSEVKRRCVYSPEIERCHKYVATHLFEEINVRIIADTLGVSTSYISHKFKEETGQTIVSFIQMSKIEAAKLMLENIELSVNDVMSRLGYISQSHFSQVFKKNTGLTPGKYRLAIKRQSQAQKKTSAVIAQNTDEGAEKTEWYVSALEYGERKGLEQLSYDLSCIRRGKTSDLKERMESPDYQAEMQKLFAGKVRYAVEAFICCWTQAVHVAIESGMDIRFSAALLQNYMARLYESETVNETLDLNSQYLLELASNIAKL